MIVLIVFIIVALVLGGLLGTLLVRDPGYVLVAYDGMTMETSLWMAVLLLLAVAAVVKFITWSLRGVLRSHGVLSAWFGDQRRESSHRLTEHGLMLLAEGRYREAWSALRDGARGAEFPLLNYLDAARAAQAMGDDAARDRCFDEAVRTQPNAAFAVAITKAAMQQEKDQWAESARTLEAWREHAPRHPTLHAMLLRARHRLGDWDAVHELLPKVTPHEIASEAEYDEIRASAWLGKLHGAAESGQADAHARALWKRIPNDVKVRGGLLSAYAKILCDAGDVQGAEEALRKALKRALTGKAPQPAPPQGSECEWIALYGQIVADAERQISTVQDWLARVRQADGGGSGKGDSDTAVLEAAPPLKTAPPPKAAAALEAAPPLKTAPPPKAVALEAALCLTLARLKETRGDADAQDHYQQSFALDPTPAARLGLARTLIAAGATAKAEQTLADGI